MKHIGFISKLVCAALMFAGCSNEFEDVFNGNYKDVIAPIELNDEENTSWSQLPFNDIIPPVITALGFKSAKEMYQSDDIWEFATIVNDEIYLKDITDQYGTITCWPRIDFQKYSLLVGWFLSGGSGDYIERQRIIEKNGTTILYLEIKESEGIHSFNLTYSYFCALYPKLDANPIEVKRWNNY